MNGKQSYLTGTELVDGANKGIYLVDDKPLIGYKKILCSYYDEATLSYTRHYTIAEIEIPHLRNI